MAADSLVNRGFARAARVSADTSSGDFEPRTSRNWNSPTAAELERKIKAQVQALERGIESELVSERIGELHGEKAALEVALAGIGADREEAENEGLTAQLARLPELSQALRDAPAAIKRQVFASFDLQIAYDRVKPPG